MNPKTTRRPRSNRHATLGTRHSRAGSAMSEMVLVLPVLLLVFAFLLFFGRAMVQAQRARVVDRYAAWQMTHEAPGPAWQLNQSPETLQLNDAFFTGKAAQMDRFIEDDLPRDAEQYLTNAAGSLSADGEQLAEEVFGRLPGGRTVGFETRHETSVPAYQQFNKTITHRHTRMDNDWKFSNSFRDIEGTSWRDFPNSPLDKDWPPSDTVWGQWQPWPTHGNWWVGGLPVSLMTAVREALYEELDQPLTSLQVGGNVLAGQVRYMLVSQPGYGGPTIHLNDDTDTP